tara:strand:- start:2785 stop:4566 length:1782 start_codon:yes stop_codon:yes gene_type:complete
MARQPRQQSIGFYGKFQPTGVDNSAAQRMQALAGLGETVAGIAEQFGAMKASEKKAEQAEADKDQAVIQKGLDREAGAESAQAARTVDESGNIIYGDIPLTESEVKNAAARSVRKTGTLLDVQKTFDRFREENPTDSAAYLAKVKGYESGLFPQLDSSLFSVVEKYFYDQSKFHFDAISKAETAQIKGEAKASYAVARDTFSQEYLGFIHKGEIDEAEAFRKSFNEDMMPDFLRAEAITLEGYTIDELALTDTARVEQELGRIERTIIGNEDLTIDEKVAAGKQYLSIFDDTDLGLDLEEKRSLRENVSGLFDAMKIDEEAKIEADRQATYLQQTINIDAYDVEFLNTDKPKVEKLVELEALNTSQDIGYAEYTARKRLIAAQEKYDAAKSSPEKERLFYQMYDVMQISRPEDFLPALNNLKNNIINAEAGGALSEPDAESLLASFQNLTASSSAYARKKVSSLFDKTRSRVQETLPIENWGYAYGEIYMEALPELQETLDVKKSQILKEDPEIEADDYESITLSIAEEESVYKAVGDRVISNIRSENTARSNAAIANAQQKSAPPTVTTQAQLATYPSGSVVLYNGQLIRKP